MDFLSKYGSQYYSKKIINGVPEVAEREGRQEALYVLAEECTSKYSLADRNCSLSEPSPLCSMPNISSLWTEMPSLPIPKPCGT